MDNQKNISLAGFLFGNIDESGELDTDIFDSDEKTCIGSLTRLGLGSFLDEIIGVENILKPSSLRKNSESGSDSDDEGEPHSENLINDSEDFNFDKAPNAIDYGDESELAEDPQYEIKQQKADYVHVENNTEFTAGDMQKLTEDNTDYDADDEEAGTKRGEWYIHQF